MIRRQRFLSRLVLTLTLLFVIGTACVDAEPAPDDILNKSTTMLTDECEFACCYEVLVSTQSVFLRQCVRLPWPPLGRILTQTL